MKIIDSGTSNKMMIRKKYENHPDEKKLPGHYAMIMKMKSTLRFFLVFLFFCLLTSTAGATSAIPKPGAVAEAVAESRSQSSNNLRIHFLDVGQGDAILIISPDNRAVLIDGGPRAGGAKILELLKQESIESLDLVIASHAHLDHIGGLQTVIESVPVRFYMDPGYPHSTRAYERLLQTLESKNIRVLQGRAGRRINLGGDAVIEIMAPTDNFHRGTRSDVNANSIIARLVFNDFSVLFTGDAEIETERFLTGLPDIRTTVLKVAHHGSRHSTTAAFLERVSPEIAVIQVGEGNSYGHPHPDTLQRLEAAGTRIFRNDKHGTVIISSNGNTFTVKTEKNKRAEFSGGTKRNHPNRQRSPPVMH